MPLDTEAKEEGRGQATVREVGGVLVLMAAAGPSPWEADRTGAKLAPQPAPTAAAAAAAAAVSRSPADRCLARRAA